MVHREKTAGLRRTILLKSPGKWWFSWQNLLLELKFELK
jgi:hypothetical protein